jgi:hypothetical protein
MPATQDDVFIARLCARIDRGRPTALVLENFAPTKGRENALRRRDLAAGIASDRRIGTAHVSRKIVQRVLGVNSKQQVARRVAGRFPELQSRLPPERQRWSSEDERAHIFDALSFALVVMAPEDDWEDQS